MSFCVTPPELGAQSDGCCANTALGCILHKHFPRTRQPEGAGEEAAAFDCASGKLPEVVFPRIAWEPLAQPRAELTSPESFRDNPFSPNQFCFLTESRWKEPFDFSDLGRVPNAPKNPLLHFQANSSTAGKNFNLCFCQILTQSQVKGGGSAGALAPCWQFYENYLFLSLLVISPVSRGVSWYDLSLSLFLLCNLNLDMGWGIFLLSSHLV